MVNTQIPITLENKPATLLHQARLLYKIYTKHTAVIFVDGDSETTITYGEFFERAAQYAHAMAKIGVKPGDLVGLVLQHSEAVLYSFWGAMLLGAVPSIFPFLTEKLDRDTYFESTRQLINHSNVRVVITYTDLEAQLQNHLAGIDTLAGIINAETLQPGGDIHHYLDLNPANPEDTAFLQHSSGSTGLQKGVMLSHQAVINQIASYSTAISLKSDDVIVSWLPLYHDMGLIAAFIMPILQGIKVVMMSPFRWVRDPKMLLQAIQKHHGTLCWLPNFAYNFLATRVRDDVIAGLDLSSMRAFINCSEPVYAESHQLFMEKYRSYGLHENTLLTCYAMAENTFAVTQSDVNTSTKIDGVDRQKIMDEQLATQTENTETTQIFVSCGKPIPNCEIKITGENGATLPERHVGEIALRSDSMLSGYYNRPELSAEAIQDGWYYTGDMGYIAEGELYITGRKKDLIIVGGKNVYPQDIENLLNDIPGLYPGRATAFGVYNDKLGTEDIVIVAELRADVSLDDKAQHKHIMQEIRARVAQNTDVTARFLHLVEPGWLIKTSSGKIARRANRQKFLDERFN